MVTEKTKSARKTCDCSIVSVYRSRVKTVAGTSDAFALIVGVHQGSAISPLLFIKVMEEAAKLTRGDGTWELLYADDLSWY